MPLIQWIMQNLQVAHVSGSALLLGDSSISATAQVIHPVPLTPPPDNDRYSLGVTFGIPGWTKRKRKRKNIKVKFTFAGNTYDYEEELGDAIHVILKGLGPEKSKHHKPPLITLETLKAEKNGQNYNLQE